MKKKKKPRKKSFQPRAADPDPGIYSRQCGEYGYLDQIVSTIWTAKNLSREIKMCLSRRKTLANREDKFMSRDREDN